MKISIGIVDDKKLFLKSLASLINAFDEFETVIDSLGGEDFLKNVPSLKKLPDIVLLDVFMPGMTGQETAHRISKLYPEIRIVALSENDEDTIIINMLNAGCCSYLLKDIHPEMLRTALLEIQYKGFYNADVANINFRRLILNEKNREKCQFSERERLFLKLACSDKTYKQIAQEMHLAERTIDGYREAIFEKLNVQSRVGMALEAIRRGLVSLK